MRTLKVFESGDGAHCGITDWYPNKEAALKRALRSGKPFDTGWYSSKKEIASARIWRDGKDVHVEVSVSDDFDTEGMGSALVFGAHPKGLEQVREALYRAWAEATENQKDNRAYAGYSVLHWSAKIPSYRLAEGMNPKETRKRYARKQCSWLETYLVSVAGMDSPPGDNYHFWGWQSDPTARRCMSYDTRPAMCRRFICGPATSGNVPDGKNMETNNWAQLVKIIKKK